MTRSSKYKDRPILFPGPEVRAILREIEQSGAGKTQTRRVLTPRGANVIVGCYEWNAAGQEMVPIPRVARGNRLYVREAWRMPDRFDGFSPSVAASRVIGGLPPNVFYEADGAVHSAGSYAGTKGKFRQGIYMPRWASRIILIVTDVRVQRLQEISEVDAVAEGMEQAALSHHWRDYGPDPLPFASPVESYRSLWNSLNAKRGYGWDTNPWVAAITFNPILRNIDQMGAA